MDRFIEVILFGQGDGRLRYIPSEELAAQVCFARTNLDAKKGDCCEMFQDVSRNRKVLGVLMSMPETSRDILRCYSLLWPRPGGRKAEGLQADLLYAWCAA